MNLAYVVYYNLKELSFREYLELKEGLVFPALSLDEILKNHVKIAGKISRGRPILKHFRNYLSTGAYPFIMEGENTYLSKLLNVVEKVIYVYNYIEYLARAGMINSVASEGRGYKLVRKPAKILMANSNLLFAVNSSMMSESERGTVRETFFVSQVGNSLKTTLADKGDFKVGERYVFEIGGSGKDAGQINGIKDSYVAADGIHTLLIKNAGRMPAFQLLNSYRSKLFRILRRTSLYR